MNGSMKKTSISTLVLSALVVGTMPTTTHTHMTAKEAVACASAIALFAAVMRLEQKESEKEPKARYELKKLLEISSIASKEYWENIWHLIDDGFIGTKVGTGAPKFVPGSKDIKWSPDKPQSGVLGNTHMYTGLAAKAAKTVVKAAAAPALVAGALYALSGSEKAMSNTSLKDEKGKPVKSVWDALSNLKIIFHWGNEDSSSLL